MVKVEQGKRVLQDKPGKAAFAFLLRFYVKLQIYFIFEAKLLSLQFTWSKGLLLKTFSAWHLEWTCVWFCLGMFVILGKVNTIRKYQRKHIINNRILLKFSITNNQTFNFLSVITGSYIFILHIAISSIFISMYS